MPYEVYEITQESMMIAATKTQTPPVPVNKIATLSLSLTRPPVQCSRPQAEIGGGDGESPRECELLATYLLAAADANGHG
jgi:hypothetical protein